jgi:hypothetical protein
MEFHKASSSEKAASPKWFSTRLPDRRTLFLVFTVCVLPIQIWSWVLMLNKLPSYLKNLRIVQMIDVFAYTQAFALLESLLLCGLLLLLAFLLPGSMLRDHWVAQSALIVTLLTLWAIGLHLMFRSYQHSETTAWDNQLFIFWAIACLAGLLGFSWLLRTWTPLEKTVASLSDRSTVLAAFFVLVDMVSVSYLMLRMIYLAIL